MGSNKRKRSASVAKVAKGKAAANKKPASSKATTKASSQEHANPTTAWDAVTTKYPTEINQFFPSQASIPDSLSIVQYLANLPAVDGALDDRVRRVGTNPFTLELGTKGSIEGHHKYDHFHARNQSSRAQGNFKAVLAQASGSPAPVPCLRCSQSRTLWETCMKAAKMPGLGKEDALGGACPGCYYNGTGSTCSNRPPKKTKDQLEAASESDVGLLGLSKMQQLMEISKWLMADNSRLRKRNARLETRVEELEDMIEAEEQQCMI